MIIRFLELLFFLSLLEILLEFLEFSRLLEF